MWTQASLTISVPKYPCLQFCIPAETTHNDYPCLTPRKYIVYVTLASFSSDSNFFLSLYFYRILDIPLL